MSQFLSIIIWKRSQFLNKPFRGMLQAGRQAGSEVMNKGGSHYVQHPAGETGDSKDEPLLFSANPKKIKHNTSFSMNAHHSMS